MYDTLEIKHLLGTKVASCLSGTTFLWALDRVRIVTVRCWQAKKHDFPILLLLEMNAVESGSHICHSLLNAQLEYMSPTPYLFVCVYG